MIGNFFVPNSSNEFQTERILFKKENKFNVPPLILTLPDQKNTYTKISTSESALAINKSNSTKIMLAQNHSLVPRHYHNNTFRINISRLEQISKKRLLIEQRELFLKTLNDKVRGSYLNNKLTRPEFSFLKTDELKNYSTCINNDQKLQLSVRSKALKNDSKINLRTREETKKSVIPIIDIYLEHNLISQTKSIYCNDPIVSPSEQNFFSRLFKNFNEISSKEISL
jgi:hypothetical protein